MSAPNKLHEPDLAGLLVPAEVTVDRLRELLTRLGISRATVDRITSVDITPDRVQYELRIGPEWQRVAVETRVVRRDEPSTIAVELRVTS